MPAGNLTSYPAPNFTVCPSSGVTVTLPTSNNQISLSPYVQSKELAPQVHIGQLLIPNSSIVLSGQGEVINIDINF